ncbi:MAG: hypothetical protein WDO69_09000 [Pseudomonadota bacterium]
MNRFRTRPLRLLCAFAFVLGCTGAAAFVDSTPPTPPPTPPPQPAPPALPSAGAAGLPPAEPDH